MATILIINGRHEGEWYTVGDKPLTLGRDETLLAEIIDPRVSRRHLEVFREPKNGRYYAQDLNSRNGSKHNGQRFSDKVALTDGDILQIGHTLLAFTDQEFDEPEDAEKYIEACKQKMRPTVDELAEREEHTEAAALFSRLFRRPGSKK